MMLLPIKNYPEGYDLTIMNTRYRYPRKNPETEKWDNGSMDLVIKDNVLNTKFVHTINDPSYLYYMAKEHIPIDYHQLFIPVTDVDPIEVPYRNLEKDIAERTNNLDFYFDNLKSGTRYQNKQLHANNRVFFSDTHIEDHYRFRFANTYANPICDITKAYFDIEADTRIMAGDFPEPGECPINAISYINDSNKTIYVFLLRDKGNPQIDEFEEKLKSGNIERELKEFIEENVNGWKNVKRFGLDGFKFQFMLYDEEDEIKLIQDLFLAINQFKPDFLLAWNMAFDIPYIIARIKKLGYDPAEIMCHPDFKYKEASYYVDERNKNEYAERGDFASISSYTIYLDQMIQFASRRKGQGQFTSFGLDFIGGLITGVRKLDYHQITPILSELPRKNYKIFVFYNIMDTIVQKCIESKVGDIDYIFGKCISNNTRYAKGHRQTVYLANRGAQEFFNDGYIIGNNINKWNEKPEDKFAGAFVANPDNLSDYAKKKINGIAVNIFDNLDDFDYKSLYPSILREFNMAPNTQIGMVTFPEQIHLNENRLAIEKYTRSTAFMEDLQSGNILEFCTRWLHLASYGELIDDIEKYFTTIQMPNISLMWYDRDTMLRIPVVKYDSSINRLINPIIRYDDGILRSSPIIKAIGSIPTTVKEGLLNEYGKFK